MIKKPSIENALSTLTKAQKELEAVAANAEAESDRQYAIIEKATAKAEEAIATRERAERVASKFADLLK